jgi:hypothetical protein
MCEHVEQIAAWRRSVRQRRREQDRDHPADQGDPTPSHGEISQPVESKAPGLFLLIGRRGPF